MHLLELKAGDARLRLAPDMGAGIISLDLEPSGKTPLPILRPGDSRQGDGSVAVSCHLLAPFSNRLSGGGFYYAGNFHPVPSNLPGEPMPIHGDAFQRAWQVIGQTGACISMQCRDGAIGPFRYCAWQWITLRKSSLMIELLVENRSTLALPYGIGFHPWFPRDASTQIQFEAVSVWEEDEHHLPIGQRTLSDAPQWSYLQARPMPFGWINNAYSGWKGSAEIHQGKDAKSVRLSASRLLDHMVVFSPGEQADFLCLEPVSHPVDAHHLPGMPGLRVLQSGERISGWMYLEW